MIGAAFDAWMIVPDWVRGTSTPESAGVTLERVIDHIDHICQLAGNARHCMIGSDLDGAFGREQCPSDVETIADLAKIPDLLRKRGYSDDDVRGIMHGNFVRFLRRRGRRTSTAKLQRPTIPTHPKRAFSKIADDARLERR